MPFVTGIQADAEQPDEPKGETPAEVTSEGGIRLPSMSGNA